MTDAKAIRILTEARRELDDLGPTLGRDSERMERLEAKLLTTSLFEPLRNAWYYSPDGGGSVSFGFVGRWALQQLLAGSSPAEVCAAAADQIEANEVELVEAAPVFGALVNEETELEPGVRILPAAQAPAHWLSQNVTQTMGDSWMAPRSECLLLQKVALRPAYQARRSPDDEASDRAAVTVPGSNERALVSARVRAALLLSCGSGIELPTRRFVAAPGVLFVGSAGTYGSRESAFIYSRTPVNADEVCARYNALKSFDSSEGLLRAIDRLGRARLGRTLADSAIDLGMAAEIALLHETNSKNTEITYKLATRAAWLLGADYEERSRVSVSMAKLYAERSTAVHEGALSRKSKFNSVESDELVRRILDTILSRGKFPVWKALTLGG